MLNKLGKDYIEIKNKIPRIKRDELLANHIDIRLFGVMFVVGKENFKSTEQVKSGLNFKQIGPVQFGIGQSLNTMKEDTDIIRIGMTSAKYVGEFDYEPASNKGEYLPVSSIISFTGRMPKIKLEKNVSFATEEDIAIHIDNGRRLMGTYSVLYGVKPGSLLVADKDIVKVGNNTYVKFLPTSARVST